LDADVPEVPRLSDFGIPDKLGSPMADLARQDTERVSQRECRQLGTAYVKLATTKNRDTFATAVG
jgi:hypothetical protein